MDPIENARQAVMLAVTSMLKSGTLSGTGGNISARVAGTDQMVITPSAFDYAEMTSADLCLLGTDLRVAEGEWKPSIESGLHMAVYRARSDVQTIIHSHQAHASMFGLINTPIPPLFDEQLIFLGKAVEIIPYAPSGTEKLVSLVHDAVKTGNNAYILANHGCLIFGPDMARTLSNVTLLEKCATAYSLALSTGKEISVIPDEVVNNSEIKANYTRQRCS